MKNYANTLIDTKNRKLKLDLSKEEQKKIIDFFNYKVVKVKKDSIIVKINKFGYEIFHSGQNERYWIYLIFFEEPFDPNNPVYHQHWVGRSFIGYGFETIEEILEKSKVMDRSPMNVNAPTRDYLDSWDEEKQRIVLTDEKKYLSYEKFCKFRTWYLKNKIRIMTKQKHLKYDEDNKENKTARSILMSKLSEPPKRPREMSVSLLEQKIASTKVDDAKKKKYLVGFLYK